MRQRYQLAVAMVATIAFELLLGCTITSGGLTTDGFGWAWFVTDEDGAALTCGDAAADLARLIVTDAKGTAHTFDWRCGDGFGAWGATSGERAIATGAASVTAQLIRLTLGASALDEQVLSAASFTHDLSVVSASNELGQVQFVVDAWDPQAAADASLRWAWQIGAEWIDDPTPEDYPSSTECAAAGIDYVDLWIWSPEYDQWWIDTTWTRFPCGAYEHPNGETFAGLWLPEFLDAGIYALFLGFYAEGEPFDSLVYYDDSRAAIDLVADVSADLGYNDLGGTLIDPAAHELGPLVVELSWEQAEGGFAGCYDSDVAALGFRLARGDWIAAAAPISEGGECRDRLTFAALPVLAGGYELQVVGLSADDRLRWHQTCPGLLPDGDAASAAEATARECAIARLPEG